MFYKLATGDDINNVDEEDFEAMFGYEPKKEEVVDTKEKSKFINTSTEENRYASEIVLSDGSKLLLNGLDGNSIDSCRDISAAFFTKDISLKDLLLANLNLDAGNLVKWGKYLDYEGDNPLSMGLDNRRYVKFIFLSNEGTENLISEFVGALEDFIKDPYCKNQYNGELKELVEDYVGYRKALKSIDVEKIRAKLKYNYESNIRDPWSSASRGSINEEEMNAWLDKNVAAEVSRLMKEKGYDVL